jgi:hypothetical protein
MLSHLLLRHHDSSEFAAGYLIGRGRPEHIQALLERFTIASNSVEVALRVHSRNNIDLEFGHALRLIRRIQQDSVEPEILKC